MTFHPKYLLRLLQINHILHRNGLDKILCAQGLCKALCYLNNFMLWNGFNARRTLPRGVRIRNTLEQLGPIYIKLGQILSTRRDLLPADIADELAKLQDKVQTFPAVQARRIIEKTYGQKIETLFDNFDDTPLASASIAQVHTARRKDGREIIIKIVRPDILPRIRRDLGLLKQIAALAEHYSAEARRLRPCEVVRDYEKVILDELDLCREAANASQLRRMFANSSIFCVPAVHWELVRSNILVMERISGINISDVQQLHARGVNMKILAERGVEIFFSQVFTHNFFHADMHPGNIFVNAADPENPKYIGVDFGIMGTLSKKDQRYLAENFLAFFNRDYLRVAQLHLNSGWAPGHIAPEEFEAAIRTVCEPIFERPLKEISFGRFLLNLFQTAQRFNLHIQPQLVLLQKTLLNIEGLGRQLYPDLDLWATAKPFLEKNLQQQTCLKIFLDKLPLQTPEWLYKLPDMPEQLINLLEKAVEGNLHTTLLPEQLHKLQQQLTRNQRQHYYSSLGSSLLLAATLLYGLHQTPGIPPQSWLLGIPGLLLLIAAWPKHR